MENQAQLRVPRFIMEEQVPEGVVGFYINSEVDGVEEVRVARISRECILVLQMARMVLGMAEEEVAAVIPVAAREETAVQV
jgi:hypothetical protein